MSIFLIQVVCFILSIFPTFPQTKHKNSFHTALLSCG
jgi:hypothetical protein